MTNYERKLTIQWLGSIADEIAHQLDKLREAQGHLERDEAPSWALGKTEAET